MQPGNELSSFDMRHSFGVVEEYSLATSPSALLPLPSPYFGLSVTAAADSAPTFT